MKSSVKALLLLILILAGTYGFWLWGFCRIEIDADEMAILVSKSGKPRPAGQLLANAGEQGILLDPLAEGRHFRNPYLFDVEIKPALTIPPKKVGVVTSKIGTELAAGEFLAQPGQKGIWRQVLGPGKYRLNPYAYQIDLVDAVNVPIGYVGVVTGLSGKPAPEGQFAGPDEKGIRKTVLQPGLYYLNPKELKIDILEVGLNQVSLLAGGGGAVITKTQMNTANEAMRDLQSNMFEQQAQNRNSYMQEKQGGRAPEEDKRKTASRSSWGGDTGYEGKPAAPAMRNGEAPVTDRNKLPDNALVFNQVVEFPSRDGFLISLDMTVEFELLPDNIASIYQNYGDLPQVVDKLLLPQILSISRLKGSAYRAKDFITGDGREKFQNDLTATLVDTLGDKLILIHNALIRHVNVPQQILDPIQQASLATEQDLTNKEKQNTAKKQAELNTENSMIEQRGQEVAQETIKMKAEIVADTDKKVAELQAKTSVAVAEIARQTALIRADITRSKGEAAAKVVEMVEGEKSLGYQLQTQAFGDPQAFAMFRFAETLNPAVKINIMHSGPGTLWTDLDKAMMGSMGGAKILQDAAQPKPQK